MPDCTILREDDNLRTRARMKILLATENPHKAKEIAPLLAGCDIQLVTLKDLPEVTAAVEDGVTLQENAIKKAVGPARTAGLWTLADDTGLEVDALDGAPGVYSARYAGEACSFQDNMTKLLKELAAVPAAKRSARFRTVVALSSPTGEVETVEGVIEGAITEQPVGAQGFGYDPVFFATESGKTLAELTATEKNAVSHRGRAIRAILPRLKQLTLAHKGDA
jgi:XTP/dITP diphosphohydrolase